MGKNYFSSNHKLTYTPRQLACDSVKKLENASSQSNRTPERNSIPLGLCLVCEL